MCPHIQHTQIFMYYREQYLKEFERKPEETHTNTRRTCKLTETHRNFLPQPWFEPKTTVLTTEPLCCPNWPNYSAWVVVEVGDPSDKAPKPDVIFQHWSQAGQQPGCTSDLGMNVPFFLSHTRKTADLTSSASCQCLLYLCKSWQGSSLGGGEQRMDAAEPL